MMRVRDLRALIDELRNIFAASGAKPQLKSMDQVSAALAQSDEESLETYLDRVRSRAQEFDGPRAAGYVNRLAEAALDEPAFLKVLAEIKGDRSLNKVDLQKIVEAYTGSFDHKTSKAKLIDAVNLAFYKRLYERDSRAIARRATPV